MAFMPRFCLEYDLNAHFKINGGGTSEKTADVSRVVLYVYGVFRLRL